MTTHPILHEHQPRVRLVPAADGAYRATLDTFCDVPLVLSDSAAAVGDHELQHLALRLWHAIRDRLDRRMEVTS